MAHPPVADRSSRPTDAAPEIPEPILLGMYRNIYATRRFELTCIEFYRQGLIRGTISPAPTAGMGTASARGPTCGG
jgi:TPP-dependent pyruvate/acetoin dehydrogenase alpha subunit